MSRWIMHWNRRWALFLARIVVLAVFVALAATECNPAPASAPAQAQPTWGAMEGSSGTWGELRIESGEGAALWP